MPILTVVKNYVDNTTLTQAELDQAFQSIETFLNTTKLDSSNIQTGGIATSNIAAGAVTSSVIATNAVGSSQLASDSSVDANRAVGTTHIKDSAVTKTKIASDVTDGVTLEKAPGGEIRIKDLGVSSQQLADGAVTAAKLVTANYVSATYSGQVFSNGTGTLNDFPTPVQVSITTHGRPVAVGILPNYVSNSQSYFGGPNSTGIPAQAAIFRDSTIVGGQGSIGTGGLLPPWVVIDFSAPAGAHTYKLKAEVQSGYMVSYNEIILFAMEL